MSERPTGAGGNPGPVSQGSDRVDAFLLTAAPVADGSCDGTVVGGGDWQECLEGTFLAIPRLGWVLVVASLIAAVVCVARRRWWLAPALPLGLGVYWGFWLALPVLLPGMCGEDPYCQGGGYLIGFTLFWVVPVAVMLALVPIVGAAWPSTKQISRIRKRQPRIEPPPRPEVLEAAERIAALFETPVEDDAMLKRTAGDITDAESHAAKATLLDSELTYPDAVCELGPDGCGGAVFLGRDGMNLCRGHQWER